MRLRRYVGALGLISCSWASAQAQITPEVLPVSHFTERSAEGDPNRIPIETPASLPRHFSSSSATPVWFDGKSVIDDVAAEPASVDNSYFGDCCSCGDLSCDSFDCETFCDSNCADSCCGSVVDSCYAPAPVIIGNSLGVPRVLFNATSFLLIPTHLTNVADNNTARTADRYSFTYQLNHNVPKSLSPTFTFDAATVLEESDLHTFRLSAEKRLFRGNVSLMFSAPMYSTISRHASTGMSEEGFEFGKLAFGPKLMLIENNGFVLSTGALIETPTDRPMSIDGNDLASNKQWYISPFIAASKTRGRFFTQAFVSHRSRTGVEIAPLGFGGFPLATNDLLMADAQFGWWMRQRAGTGVTGIAPIVELHYSGNTEQEPDAYFSTTAYTSLDQLTLTAGTTLEINERHTLSVGYGVPLRDNALAAGFPTDRLFDGELTLHLNMYR